MDVQSQHIMGCLSGEKELALLSIVRVVLKVLTNYNPADYVNTYSQIKKDRLLDFRWSSG